MLDLSKGQEILDSMKNTISGKDISYLAFVADGEGVLIISDCKSIHMVDIIDKILENWPEEVKLALKAHLMGKLMEANS
jgi:hypothetical protein